MQNLTFNEKQAFIFGYLKGNMEGIHSTKHPDSETKKSKEEWEKLAQFSDLMYDELCLKMGMPNIVDKEFKAEIQELQNEANEIILAFANQMVKQK